jgi:prevent-host-death family protein
VEVPASEVKNAWHEYLDRVSTTREEVVITRYGKPIARLAPVEPPAEERRSIFGWMAGTVTIHGDIIEPLDVEWDAMHE